MKNYSIRLEKRPSSAYLKDNYAERYIAVVFHKRSAVFNFEYIIYPKRETIYVDGMHDLVTDDYIHSIEDLNRIFIYLFISEATEKHKLGVSDIEFIELNQLEQLRMHILIKEMFS